MAERRTANPKKRAGNRKKDGALPSKAKFQPKTALGRRLWQVRQRIIASGQPLLDWAGIERELRERAGQTGEEA